MNTSAQEQALLDLIAADCTRRCDEIRNESRRQADALLREAHLNARDRLRRVLNDARDRARQRVAAAEAQLQTRERLEQQNSAGEFLKRALQLLPAALSQRWRQPQTRTRWVQMALDQAQHSLPTGAWRVEHADGLLPEEIAPLLTDCRGGPIRNFQLNPQLIAGVRIMGNGNCIDASLSGLLSDMDNLAGALLQAWESPP